MSEESLKIGFFTDSYFPEIDGVTYTLDAWRERLEDRGYEVHIIYPDSDNYDSRENEMGIRSIPNPFYEGYNIPIPFFTDSYPDVDVVHCHSPAFLGLSGLIFGKRYGIPSVYTHHTPLEEYFEQSIKSSYIARFLTKIYVPLETFFLKRFDVLTSSTSEDRRSLEFRNIPVGVNMKFFEPTDQDFFEEMDVERPVVGYSGRISMEKNPLEILEMARSFEGTVVIVGEGPMKSKVEEEKPENVILMDFLDRKELPVFYSSLDAFVTASTGDTLGLSTLEANACGTPVVAPDVLPFNNTISKDSGMHYRKGDPEDFRSKIYKVLDSKTDARKSVREYSLSTTIDRLEEIYSGVT